MEMVINFRRYLLILWLLALALLIACSGCGPEKKPAMQYRIMDLPNHAYLFKADSRTDWATGSDLETFLKDLTQLQIARPNLQVKRCVPVAFHKVGDKTVVTSVLVYAVPPDGPYLDPDDKPKKKIPPEKLPIP